MWKYRKDYESIVITRLAFLRFYPPKPRVLRAYEHETRKHASPARVYLRNVCTRDVWLDIFLLLSSSPLPLSRSRSLAEWVYPVSLLPQGSNFLRLPHPPSPSSVVVCSQLIPHNKRKPGLGRRHRSRMGAHAYVHTCKNTRGDARV